jgi:flagellar basal body-associated protein FliL
MPQRCLSHNAVITLFCSNDMKPLCVNCIHHSSSHKNHEIIPLHKATATLQNLLESTLEEIDNRILPSFSEKIKKSLANLHRIEKEMG